MLITNGCSFVWGDELEGYNNHPPTHDKFTFTHKLGHLLGIPYENLARCGNGNDKIFRDTMVRLSDPDKPKPTHMVILWSAWQRMETASRIDRHKCARGHIQVEDCMLQFSEERTVYSDELSWGSLAKYYNEFYDVRTSILQQLNFMLTMQTLCDTMGVNLIQGAFHSRLLHNLGMVLQKTEGWEDYVQRVEHILSLLRKTSKIGLGHWTDMFTMATENEDCEIKPFDHPCENTHHEYSKLLHHIFTNVTE